MTAVLVIDTASEELGVAFVPAEGEPRLRTAPGRTHHSRVLLPLIDELLRGTDDRPQRVGVVTGPGGYAGLRVGIATAGGLALGWGVPLLGVPTLRAVAAACGIPGRIAAIHPAGRGEYAVQLFDDGEPVGELFPARRDGLPALPLAGEGAGSLGGVEIGVRDRLAAVIELLRRGLVASAEAVYLREPHVTLSRARWRRERAAATIVEEEHR
ncbi:MAG: tRNA (adenosine(37)-N6)-threonylcarbamoyltransferase complex dimerization subunit type 1 TsaB [Chloroflexota bacterium]|nr:tRNA (adenosine(37)-N6)-threonylcarbamoyltransferase complex dimerization subunit type 1 TsaB [Dehalococcoidia bacterium]MDW8045693.1 tRNA (adenosine(37)-N6)-threonylcarbamoyltransferase complex dimerization subunit type 1 TsaB [Chloroflexota bacterium]